MPLRKYIEGNDLSTSYSHRGPKARTPVARLKASTKAKAKVTRLADDKIVLLAPASLHFNMSNLRK